MNFIQRLFGKKSKEGYHEEVMHNKTVSQVETTSPNNDATREDVKEVTAIPVTDRKKNADGTVNVYHLIVLDESGSMSGITHQTISGCNETIQTIRIMQDRNSTTQRHYVSIYLFDSNNSRYIIKNKRVKNVRDLTGKDYSPNACTPLFDALGTTLTELKAVIAREESIAYVTIITDGYENASKEFTLKSVKQLIEELKTQDVIFSFIGANVDSASYAESLSINNHMQFEQSAEGTSRMWAEERRAKMRSSSKFSLRMHAFLCDEDDNQEMFGASENRGNYYKTDVPKDRISPKEIKALQSNEVFVFGSNRNGEHNGGASYTAVTLFGAISGQAEGRQGQSYAIPTEGVNKEELYNAINRFCQYAQKHPNEVFLVTQIGCGTAGLTSYEVGPMFRRATKLKNVKLPESFWDYLDFEL